MDDPRRYQQIALLCVPYKLLERLLFRLEPVVDPQLPTQQGGFLRGRSTAQQIVKLTSDIGESYEGRRWVSPLWILLRLRPMTLSGIRAWH